MRIGDGGVLLGWTRAQGERPFALQCEPGPSSSPSSQAGHLLTYEGLFVILSPQAVAAWEEGVGISLVKPGQIPEIET